MLFYSNSLDPPLLLFFIDLMQIYNDQILLKYFSQVPEQYHLQFYWRNDNSLQIQLFLVYSESRHRAILLGTDATLK
jgi:hypothetical protein